MTRLCDETLNALPNAPRRPMPLTFADQQQFGRQQNQQNQNQQQLTNRTNRTNRTTRTNRSSGERNAEGNQPTEETNESSLNDEFPLSLADLVGDSLSLHRWNCPKTPGTLWCDTWADTVVDGALGGSRTMFRDIRAELTGESETESGSSDYGNFNGSMLRELAERAREAVTEDGWAGFENARQPSLSAAPAPRRPLPAAEAPRRAPAPAEAASSNNQLEQSDRGNGQKGGNTRSPFKRINSVSRLKVHDCFDKPDWVCRSCGNRNFYQRQNCNMRFCRKPKRTKEDDEAAPNSDRENGGHGVNSARTGGNRGENGEGTARRHGQRGGRRNRARKAREALEGVARAGAARAGARPGWYVRRGENDFALVTGGGDF